MRSIWLPSQIYRFFSQRMRAKEKSIRLADVDSDTEPAKVDIVASVTI